MKFSWHGIAAFLTGAAGVIASPAILGLVPPKYAAAISGAAAIYAALSKPAVQQDTTSAYK